MYGRADTFVSLVVIARKNTYLDGLDRGLVDNIRFDFRCFEFGLDVGQDEPDRTEKNTCKTKKCV